MHTIHFCSLICPDFDADLLPHWIEHYRRYPFSSRTVWLHSHGDREKLRQCSRMLEKNDFRVADTFEKNTCMFGNGSLRAILLNRFHSAMAPNEYLAVADSDEFWTLEPSTLRAMLDRYSVIEGQLVDRYDHTPHDCRRGMRISSQFPMRGKLSREIINCCLQNPSFPKELAQTWPHGYKGDKKILVSRSIYKPNFCGSHMFVPPRLPPQEMVYPRSIDVEHYSYRSSYLDRAAGKDYISLGHLEMIAEFFGVPNDHPAIVAKKIEAQQRQEACGWTA